jgi:DNA uptake protein ComE-like DNA-binding protein
MNKKSTLLILMLVIAIALAACAPATSTTVTNNATSATTTFTGTKLNLNTVTGDELLATIPGFGNRMVREFQEYRPYISIQQFRKEIGKYVDDAQVAEYEKYVYVPVAINDSDSATLQQIPGLDAAEADTLIAARPYASNEAFLTKLSTLVSADELETAKSYLRAN